MTRNDLILVANWVILLKRLLNDPTNSREEATKLFIDEVMGDCATRNKNFSVAKFLDSIQLLVRAVDLITKLLLENKRISEENYKLREKIKDHEGLEKLLVERDIFLNK